VFATAAPPFLAHGLAAALNVVREHPTLRARPAELADRLRRALVGRLDTGLSSTHVVPVVTGTPASALALQDHLARHGWDARAIRPPTVPHGQSRVRLVMHAGLTEDDVDRLAADLLAWTP
jgi:8-amino-7-oxononanoate synthase